jgi:hypothetical protein
MYGFERSGEERLYSKSAGWAGRLIRDKRFIGKESELADLAVRVEVCLAALQVNALDAECVRRV